MDRSRCRQPSPLLRGSAGWRLPAACDLGPWLRRRQAPPPATRPRIQPPRRPPRDAAARERLSAAERRWIDRLATHLAPLPWQEKSDRLAAAALACGEPGAGPRPLAPGTVITAVLRRWSYPGVVNPYQACLYLLSGELQHRAMVERYLAAHPEDLALVAAELTGGRSPRDL
jgi:hypothetical protein